MMDEEGVDEDELCGELLRIIKMKIREIGENLIWIW